MLRPALPGVGAGGSLEGCACSPVKALPRGTSSGCCERATAASTESSTANKPILANRSFISLQPSFAPDVADALIGYRGVDNGVGYRAVAHEGPQRSCIDSAGRQGVASSMAQHVSMYREGQLSGLAKPLNQLLGAIN